MLNLLFQDFKKCACQLIWKLISSTELTTINFPLHLSVVYEILLHSMQTANGDVTRVKYGCLCHSRATNRLLFIIGILCFRTGSRPCSHFNILHVGSKILFMLIKCKDCFRTNRTYFKFCLSSYVYSLYHTIPRVSHENYVCLFQRR
jgi:hypothetical protein